MYWNKIKNNEPWRFKSIETYSSWSWISFWCFHLHFGLSRSQRRLWWYFKASNGTRYSSVFASRFFSISGSTGRYFRIWLLPVILYACSSFFVRPCYLGLKVLLKISYLLFVIFLNTNYRIYENIWRRNIPRELVVGLNIRRLYAQGMQIVLLVSIQISLRDSI